MFWVLLIGASLAGFYYIFVKPLRYWKDKGIKQSTPCVFFGDNASTILRTKSFTEWTQYVYNMYPGSRYSGFYQLYVPTLVIRDPELVKQITVKEFDHFTDHRTFIDPQADPLWGKNLFSLKGHCWREMRGTLSGSFTSSKMKHMFDLIKNASENFVKYFLEKDEHICEIEMKDVFTRFTNDVIATTAFGIKIDSLKNPNNEFYLMGKEATDFRILFAMKFFGYMLFPKIYKIFKVRLFPKKVGEFFRRIIKDTITTRQEKGIVRPDMINLLMEATKGNIKYEENRVMDSGFAVVQESLKIGNASKGPEKLTEDDIAAQAMLFFFGGFDSTSSLMSFMAYELGANQDIQENLRKEILETFSKCNCNITYEALLKMKYLDMVISETLRKWPPGLVGDRVCTKPYTIEPVYPDEKPLHLTEGQVLWYSIFGIHRDPEHYPNPDRFDPERFSDKNKDKIKPYTYLPFGAGPRNCIASRFALLEAKTVIFYLLLKFQIVPIAKTKIPLKISKKSLHILPEGGFWFGLKRVLTK